MSRKCRTVIVGWIVGPDHSSLGTFAVSTVAHQIPVFPNLSLWAGVQGGVAPGHSYSPPPKHYCLDQRFSSFLFFFFIVNSYKELLRNPVSNHTSPWNSNTTYISYICLCTLCTSVLYIEKQWTFFFFFAAKHQLSPLWGQYHPHWERVSRASQRNMDMGYLAINT